MSIRGIGPEDDRWPDDRAIEEAERERVRRETVAAVVAVLRTDPEAEVEVGGFHVEAADFIEGRFGVS